MSYVCIVLYVYNLLTTQPQRPPPRRDKLVGVQGRYHAHSDYRVFEAIEGVFDGAGGGAGMAGENIYVWMCLDV